MDIFRIALTAMTVQMLFNVFLWHIAPISFKPDQRMMSRTILVHNARHKREQRVASRAPKGRVFDGVCYVRACYST